MTETSETEKCTGRYMVYIYMIEKLDMCLGTRAGEGELLAAPQVPGLGQGGRGHRWSWSSVPEPATRTR